MIRGSRGRNRAVGFWACGGASRAPVRPQRSSATMPKREPYGRYSHVDRLYSAFCCFKMTKWDDWVRLLCICGAESLVLKGAKGLWKRSFCEGGAPSLPLPPPRRERLRGQPRKFEFAPRLPDASFCCGRVFATCGSLLAQAGSRFELLKEQGGEGSPEREKRARASATEVGAVSNAPHLIFPLSICSAFLYKS